MVYFSNIKDNEIHSANPVNINVHPGDSIQQAINSAKPGDTVIVYAGMYKENLVVDKSLIIVSKLEESTDTIIQAANTRKTYFM
ncbi:cell surface protein [Methanosarcina horonobensis HB-1 = JCM 15518]|uniref:Cell surface protein n=1 Tax=Methanosarcina horonobensis HB-1 = JCM 15518 TaxID=1434110 RepID=A0A0E3WV08_9EURY|nr:hypothetical protein [Methanosarcina horonobensis]AKB79040.1 cell surface protein [Methanosarcina horonobensis HB-1 = JCM 15518]